MELFEELEQEGIDRGLLETIRAFRAEHPVPQEAQGRLIRPKLLYYGREVWQAAATALLCGENLLRPKGHGKKRAGGKSGRRLWASRVERFHVCEYRRGFPHRGRHPEGGRGGVPGGTGVPVCPPGGLWRTGRGEYGQK